MLRRDRPAAALSPPRGPPGALGAAARPRRRAAGAGPAGARSVAASQRRRDGHGPPETEVRALSPKKLGSRLLEQGVLLALRGGPRDGFPSWDVK